MERTKDRSRVAKVILRDGASYTLASATGLEPHHLIMSLIGGNKGRLEREKN